MANSNAIVFVSAFAFVFLNLTGYCYAALEFGFYNGKCKASDVEEIVRKTVFDKFVLDRTIAPALIRMQFHDCFVTVIDAAKEAVERVCPGVVSCADIIVMATRDVVSLSGGGKYNVQTGRRDGLVSLAQNTRTLPSPSISVSSAIQAFANQGLTATDMIYLLGGHTIGITHCSLFQDRLYNFKNSGKPDPSMDLGLLSSLRRTCVQKAKVDRSVNLDQNPFSAAVVDKSFYSQIIMHKGILQIDQELALDSLSKSTVEAIARSSDFNTKFGQAMVKLGAIQVLTGSQGQIRKSCQVVNSQTMTSSFN